MEAAVVSVAHGAMGSLIGKLGNLLLAKYNLLSEAKGEIMFLKAEIESMHVFLKKISDMEDPDKQDQLWAKEVRELSYDIEDSITEFMLRVEHSSNSKPDGFKEHINRCMNLLTTMNTRHEIAKEFQGLKRRINEVNERHTRYKIDDAAKPNNTAIDLRLLALHAETTSLVGVTGPRDQLIQLMEEEDVPADQLKVLSIVGFGGLGKTTLANEIYRKLNGQFQCQAFVSVSQKPNLRKILRTILTQVGLVSFDENSNKEMVEESELISTLQNFLLDKRYFIVIDDIWDDSAWNIIKCALPGNMNGSRVITATRIETVAWACCAGHSEYVFKMKPLSEQDSRRLFLKRIFGSEDTCPPPLQEVSARILKKCGGLPLAIITISSLLANQPSKLKKQWEYVHNSLGSNFEVNPSLDGMRQILNLSYINLHHHLKACMLYLYIYPEDHTIERDDLARRWIAEGFIRKAHGIDPEDIARSYFNELINRNMIQPIDSYHNGEVKSCRVHDMMLDLIRNKSEEENFITKIDEMQELTTQYNKIRRLSFNLAGAIDDRVAQSIQLSQTRTLAIFDTYSSLPKFILFKHLRVLTIEFSDDPSSNEVVDLSEIGHLFQLRYLKISAGGYNVVLPSKIGGLQQLETLEIYDKYYSPWRESEFELPSDIIQLSQLLHLIVPYHVMLLDGMSRMKSLCTLHCRIPLDESAGNIIKSLRELTSLTDLEIIARECYSSDNGDHDYDDMVEWGSEVLQTCLEKLCNLKYLKLITFYGYYFDTLSSMHASFCHLERFSGFQFARVPRWIGQLHNLYDLSLTVKRVPEESAKILAELPSLVNLDLMIRRAPKDKIIIGGSGFPVLKRFKIVCSRIGHLIFEAGGMAKLERRELRFNALGWDRFGAAPAGMEHLSSLKEICVRIGGSRAWESNREAAESAVGKAVDMHPCRPATNIRVEKITLYTFDDIYDGHPEAERGNTEFITAGEDDWH